jgi:lipopolysaccharide biosynthesis protein
LFSTTNWLQNNKVAVCLYLYHTDLWSEFKELLLPLSKYIKLYIGLCKDNDPLNDFSDFDYEISFHDNYGADVAPFLQQLKLVKEPLLIKLHSKKSSWGFKHHINWRQMILNDLIGSEKIFLSNTKKMLDIQNSGILCNQTLLMNNREFSNRLKIIELCNRFNIDYTKVKESYFVAGNMFMAKTQIFDHHIKKNVDSVLALLYNEKGKLDDRLGGTYAHSMERIFGYINKYQNLSFIYPDHEIIKILNIDAPNKKYFSMIKMYNNYCYLLEDPNVYGYITNIKTETCTIKWHHIDHDCLTLYNILDSTTICKQES